MPEFTIDRCLTDKRLLGAELGDAATWQTWRVALKAAFGQLLSPEEREVFTAIAGNRGLPKQRVREFWCVVGRRGGKSRMAAALGVHSALFVKHRLARGERGLVLILAASKEQAGVVFDYAEAFLQSSAALRKEIVSATRSEIRLRSGITIAVHSNSFRTIRGRTLCAAIFDETAFWRDETSLMPDLETYTAVLPGLATTNGMLIGISTPYRKLGLLYQKHRDHFGVDGDDVLVVQGSSLTFNSATLSDAAVAAQRAADPTAADAEWDAIFRTDIGAFLDDELIDRAIDYGRPLELPPQDGVVYRAFVDSSGGAVGGDAYALGIGHLEGENYVTDVVRGRSGPFDPQEVTKEYAQLCRDYHVGRITGDNYGKEWVADAWRQVGFEYVKSPLPKDEIYLECLPVFTRGLVRLPNHARLVRELRLLSGTRIVLARTRSLILATATTITRMLSAA